MQSNLSDLFTYYSCAPTVRYHEMISESCMFSLFRNFFRPCAHVHDRIFTLRMPQHQNEVSETETAARNLTVHTRPELAFSGEAEITLVCQYSNWLLSRAPPSPPCTDANLRSRLQPGKAALLIYFSSNWFHSCLPYVGDAHCLYTPEEIAQHRIARCMARGPIMSAVLCPPKPGPCLSAVGLRRLN